MATEFSHLWNGLDEAERQRLMPFEIECHITHLKQAKSKAARAHRSLMDDYDSHISNLESELEKYREQAYE